MRSRGFDRTILEIWDSEKPWPSKKAKTESGFSGVSKVTNLEADRASLWENPHEFMR